MRGGASWRLAVLHALAVPLLSGCALFGFPYGDFEGEIPSPSIIATYVGGLATITLDDGTVIELDEVADGSSLDSEFGTNVHWVGADGWHLRLSGAGADAMFGMSGWLTLDRIVDGEHWTTFDTSACAVDVDRADETGVAGEATCRGIEWVDALEEPWMSEPKPLGEPEFDAEITFEADAAGASSSG